MTDTESPNCCKDCSRLHSDDQPCPQRVADALLMKLHAQGFEPPSLTEADRNWIDQYGHKVMVSSLIEEHVALMME